jgi:hypothetical protein
MSEPLLHPGDELPATVTSSKPFGVFVTTDLGVSGLVKGARADVGTMVRVRISEYDAESSQFSATLV